MAVGATRTVRMKLVRIVVSEHDHYPEIDIKVVGECAVVKRCCLQEGAFRGTSGITTQRRVSEG